MQYKQSMQKIAVYIDYINNNDSLRRLLIRDFGASNVFFYDAGDICAGQLKTNNIDLFIIPGGADLYFCEKLNGLGNRMIRQFVEDGGAYLGICAGAYYACSQLKFAENIEGFEIKGDRELKFYKGCAYGPVMEYIQDADILKSWDCASEIEYAGETFQCVYRGGPYFDEGYGERVVVRYSALKHKPAAVIEVEVGKGLAILCGPHLEYRSKDYAKTLYRHLNPNFEYEAKIAHTVEPSDQKIERLWADILRRLLRRNTDDFIENPCDDDCHRAKHI